MKNFWKKKKVFITGINGFVGANLAKLLISKGATVFGLIRNINPHSFLYFEKIYTKVILISGDITDHELLKRVLVEEKITHIFHLAAQVEVGKALKYPYLTWETNIRGTYTLLESVRETKGDIQSIIIASSDKAYGDYPVDQLPYKESFPLIPNYPYDVSKACGDLIAQSYSRNEFNLPVVITRFANIYGPGQLNFSALIPDCIRSALGLNIFKPRTNGSHFRDFLFIDDVVDLYLRMAEELTKNKALYGGEIFNAGSNDPINIKSLIMKIFKLIMNEKSFQNFKKNVDFPKIEPFGEIVFQQMDFEKIRESFQWKPATSIEKGLGLSIDWYKRYFNIQEK